MNAINTVSADRPAEALAISAFIRQAEAGLIGGRWFQAKHKGECAVTHAVIRPYMQIAPLGDGTYVRRDAVEAISIRGNESVDDVLERFSWPDRWRAACWLSAGDSVLLLTKSTLKPMYLTSPRRLGSYNLEEVKPAFWRSVGFMLRRKL